MTKITTLDQLRDIPNFALITKYPKDGEQVEQFIDDPENTKTYSLYQNDSINEELQLDAGIPTEIVKGAPIIAGYIKKGYADIIQSGVYWIN